MSKQPGNNPSVKIISPGQSAADLVHSVVIAEELDNAQVKVQVFKRKPLIVKARQVHGEKVVIGGVYFNPGDWIVVEAGKEIGVKKEDFANLYDVMDVDQDSPASIEAGLPDVELGTTIEQEVEGKRRRLVRVEVMAGKGQIAYWVNQVPRGNLCEYKVVADNTENAGASHRAGLFIEAYDGKPGGKTWVIVNKN